MTYLSSICFWLILNYKEEYIMMMMDDEEEKIMLQKGGMRILKPSTIPSIIEAHHRFCRKAVPGNIKSLSE